MPTNTKKKFIVELVKRTVDAIAIEVEASDVDEAEAIALQRDEDGELDDADWESDQEPTTVNDAYLEPGQ